jgi:hypothetical protein
VLRAFRRQLRPMQVFSNLPQPRVVPIFNRNNINEDFFAPASWRE